MDQPDRIRKFHTKPIPRIGGVSVFVAYSASFAVLFIVPVRASNMVQSRFGIDRTFFLATAIVFFTGLLDDIRGLKAWQKFLGQFAASILALCAGVKIGGIAGHHLPSWLAVPATLLWLVGCTNAFNLIDGVDGLAAGVGLFASLTTLIAALLEHNFELAVVTAPLAGALLGILHFNFNPASIFLGDSGSLLIGFLLGCYGVLWSQKSATILGMTAPLIALSIPLLDTGLAVVRRFLRRKPIFGADRSHIHHKLLGLGLTPRRVVVLIYIACGLCAALSLLQSFLHERYGGAIIVLFCAGVWVGIHYLGYTEFEMARRVILTGNFRRRLNAELQLSTFRDNLAAALTPDECWEVLQNNYSEFGFNEIRFKLGGHLFTHTTNGHHNANTWTVRMNLSENNYLNLSREYDTQPPPIVARFTDAIGEILRPKSAVMSEGGLLRRDYAIRAVQLEQFGGVKKPLESARGLQWRNSPGD